MPNKSLDAQRTLRRLTPIERGGRRWKSVSPLRALLMTGLSLFLQCSSGESLPQLPPSASAPVDSIRLAVAGKDGAMSVVALNTVVNRYAAVTADIQPGDKSISVMGLNVLNVSTGDLLMIMQMQGASLDFTDTINYGNVINYNGAGRYEFVTVTGVDNAAGTVQVSACGGGVRNAYRSAAHTQVVRVPQFTTLAVAVNGSITAPAWNGSVGGIVAIHAQTSSTINGSIDVTARGFRPGLLDNQTRDPGTSMPIFRSALAVDGGEKGEGIGGYSGDYDVSGGRYGRGAPGNGGGGGNSHNAGGGGGANAGTVAWRRGQGVMDRMAMGGAQAWLLDPGYIGNGNAFTSDGGGGRGGYTYGSTDQNALTVGPNLATWGGDSRREVGGLGGRPVDSGVTQRLFLGGGGGAGDGNNNAANQGGAGGGLVFLASPMVGGTGQVNANGENAPATLGGNNDAPGGGGGGGTVVIATQNLSGIRVNADGGRGGNQLVIANESEGPGGGGGGGYVALAGGTITTSAAGGKGGTSLSSAVTEFPVNGATDGNSGITTGSAAPLLPLIPMLDCSATVADLAVTVTDNLNGGAAVVGNKVQYTVTYTNRSTNAVNAASISDVIPAGVSPQLLSWTCTAQGGAVCPAAMGMGNIPPSQVNLPAGASLIFVVDVPVPIGATGFFTYAAAIQPPLDISDPNPANNQATRSAPVDSNQAATAADLSVTLTRSIDMVQPGQSVTLTAQVNNGGPGAVNSAQVSFSLPAGSQVQMPPGGMGWTCIAAGQLEYICNRPTLAAGAAAPPITAVVVAPTPASLRGFVSRTVVSALKNDDPNPANNTAVTSYGASAESDLAIFITKSPDSAQPGEVTTYTVDVTSSGPDTVLNPSVVLLLPPGVTIVMDAAGDGWACTKNGSAYTCTRPSILPGTTPSITAQITTPVPPSQGGPAPLLLGTVGAPTLTDPSPGNNTAVVDAANTPVRSADLALTITKLPTPSVLGSETTYTLQVTNKGPFSAPAAVVNYTLPPGSEITSFMPGEGWSCTQSGLSFTCLLGNVMAGDAPPILVKATTPIPLDGSQNAGAVVGGVIAVQARDPEPLNNSASIEAGNKPPTNADLAVRLTRTPANPLLNSEVTYTLTATNKGDSPVDNVVVTLSVPPGSEILSTDFGDWTCTRNLSTFVCSRSTLLPGEGPPINVTVRIAPAGDNDVLPGVGGGVATINGGNNLDPDNSNNVSTLSGILYHLNGGGFSCGCSVGASAPSSPLAALLLGVLGLALALRRRLRA